MNAAREGLLRAFLLASLSMAPQSFDAPRAAQQAASQPEPTSESAVMVRFTTSMGEILIELYADEAPLTVENFLSYVRDGFYDGTIFHRVIADFVVQGGGMDPGPTPRPGRGAIENEAHNGLKNLVGTLSMARTRDPHSATSQFFINLNDNHFLDHRGKTPDAWGYAVFGRVFEGMHVVEEMAGADTTTVGPYADVPVEDIVLIEAAVAVE